MGKVFFAIPSYKGIRCWEFYDALDKTINHCQSNGWETILSILQGCCYVQVARNELIKAFLDSDADSIFFLDDDIGWDCEDALNFLNMPDDVVAGIYPHKTEEENYPVVIHTEDDGRPKVREDGCIMAALIPFGFVRIKRAVIQKMWDAYQSHKYWKKVDLEIIDYVDMFPQGVKNGRWVGEDFAFCEMWGALNGEIVVVPDIDFMHYTDVGAFKGNYHRYLLRQPGGSDYVAPEGKEYEGNATAGWLTLKEQKALYDCAVGVGSVVEIGSFMGRSSIVLLNSGAEKIYCVDTWKKYKELRDDTDEKAEQRYQQFLQNVEPHKGGNGRLSVIRADSVEASKQFKDHSVDVVFIDGDHSEEGIRRDIAAWLPKAKMILCGHDYTSAWPGVKKVVDEYFGGHRYFETVDTFWKVLLV